MDIKEAVIAALKEVIFPELQELKKDIADLKSGQAALHARVSDLNAHLVDQSRRLDQLRTELKNDIHQLRTELKEEIHQGRTDLGDRIDKVDERLGQTRAELGARLDKVETLLVQVRAELGARLDKVQGDLVARIDRVILDLIETNRSIARLYEVIVRRDDYQQLQERVARIEHQVAELRQKAAA